MNEIELPAIRVEIFKVKVVGPEQERKIGPAGISSSCHLCAFYQSEEDMIQYLSSYFRAGLEQNGRCLWLSWNGWKAGEIGDIKEQLRSLIPHLSTYERDGKMEFIDIPEGDSLTRTELIKKIKEAFTSSPLVINRKNCHQLHMAIHGNASKWASDLELYKFEEELRDIGRQFKISCLCLFDMRQLPSNQVYALMRSHEGTLAKVGRQIELMKPQTGRWQEADVLLADREKSTEAPDPVQELKRAIQELKYQIKMRDEFVSLISHELKNPITSMKLFLEMIVSSHQRHDFGPEEINEKLKKAMNQAKHLQDLVTYLLDMGRYSHCNFPLALEKVNLSECLKEALLRYKEEFSCHQIGLEVDMQEAVVGLWDRMRLEQVLNNLFSNCVKYAPRAKVQINLKSDGKTTYLSVKDHGPGIAEENLQRIFDKFVRLTSQYNAQSFGLGLWIAREIAKAHGGTIQVEGQLGSGTTFTLILPNESPGGALNQK